MEVLGAVAANRASAITCMFPSLAAVIPLLRGAQPAVNRAYSPNLLGLLGVEAEATALLHVGRVPRREP